VSKTKSCLPTASGPGGEEVWVVGKEVLTAWSDEAARDDDPVLAALLLQLAALRESSDHWSIEMLKRIADLKVGEAAAAAGGQAGGEDWPEYIES
jgi:hypothetical protein